ncbi:MAG: hypothetical protein RLP15_13790 [Cryomorphaceae bacterium]
MKKIYALLLSLLPLFSFGQFTVEWHTPDLKEGNPGEDIGFDYTLTNESTSDSIDISWKFTHDLANSSGVWEDYMCEGIFVCWPATVRFNTFTLAPEQGVDMYHHILTLNEEDTGMYVSTAFIWQADDSVNTVQEMVVTAHVKMDEGDPTGLDPIFGQKASLQQNAPNPYKGSTIIKYNLAGDAGTLKFQDLTGKLVMEMPLNKQIGSVNVHGQLESGIYFYSLWENGAMVDSKRMQVID